MSANDKQVGGSHYRSNAMQHWDLISQLNRTYLVGCATKYLWRFKKKNGRQDLEKAKHYCEKLMEKSIPGVAEPNLAFIDIVNIAAAEHWGTAQMSAIYLLVASPYPGKQEIIRAISLIDDLIAKYYAPTDPPVVPPSEDAPSASALHPS